MVTSPTAAAAPWLALPEAEGCARQLGAARRGAACGARRHARGHLCPRAPHRGAGERRRRDDIAPAARAPCIDWRRQPRQLRSWHTVLVAHLMMAFAGRPLGAFKARATASMIHWGR